MGILKKDKFYSLDNINSKDATYNIIIGERSNGKTYAVFKQALKNYVTKGEQFALVRRWKEDFVGKRGSVMFDALVNNKEVSKLTKGAWSGIKYNSSKWYLCRKEDDTIITDPTPFAYAFALSDMEHDKSTSYPNITTIGFDEFLTRFGYLRDEFVLFINVVSTIVRHRTNVKIYMMGNTVNKSCPYFEEMGLKHIKQMHQGDIDVYTYGESRLKVAVEYCKTEAKKKEKANNFYFAFDNPRLKMITSGAWEVDIYPHLPYKYKPKDIIFSYFIEFEGDMLQCDIVSVNDTAFTFIHKKTTPLKEPDTDIIYTTVTDPRPNWRMNMLKPVDMLDKKITSFFSSYKVFYQTNDIGEIVRNYVMWCKNKGGSL